MTLKEEIAVMNIIKQLKGLKNVEVEIYNNRVVTYHTIFNVTIETLWTKQGKMIRQQKFQK